MSVSIPEPEQTVATLVHPNYDASSLDWFKWRLTYLGGRLFKQRYLAKFSSREDDDDYQQRLAYSYSPSFSKGAVNDVKNSIYSRMPDITRVKGTKSYMDAVEGKNGGVDLAGRSMNTFMGQMVLAELGIMGRVGVFIDRPGTLGPTMADNLSNRPYLYIYTAENIRSWVFDQKRQLKAVLLRDYTDNYEQNTGLPTGQLERFRRLWIAEDGYVHALIYDDKGEEVSDEVTLKLREIPFAWMELTESLLTDIADYQIAMLNLASSNIGYALKSNFPFYTEQYDPRTEGSNFVKPVTVNLEDDTGNSQGIQGPIGGDQSKEVKVGVTHGRRYPKEVAAPAFIHPSPEPLDVSMKLMDKMKEEIRQLLNLTLSSLEPKFASAESKDRDQLGLESGLSYIGLELENGERKIARIWAAYENDDQIATINYPERYSLKTDGERKLEAKALQELRSAVPSRTGQKALSKRIADVLLSHQVSYDTLVKINKEIDAAPYLGTDAKDIKLDIDNGLVGRVTASNARGYDGEKEVPLATQEHVDKLAAIAEAQAVVKDMRTADQQSVAVAAGDQKDQQANPAQANQAAKTTDKTDPTKPQTKRGDGQASNK